MSLLLLHQNISFEDATVQLRGNAYLKCRFVRCNILVRDGEFMLNECEFSSCVWHLDAVIASKGDYLGLKELLALIDKSVIEEGADADEILAKSTDSKPK